MDRDLQYLIPRKLREAMTRLGFQKELEAFETTAKIAGLFASLSKEQLDIIIEYVKQN